MKSKAQRRFLWATNPEVAGDFEESTPPGKKLPEHVKRSALSEAVPVRRPRTEELRLKRRLNDDGEFFGHDGIVRQACMNADEVAEVIHKVDQELTDWRSNSRPTRPNRTSMVHWGTSANPNAGPVGNSPTGVGNLGYPA